MKRADQDLAFLLRYENVAWYEQGTVTILDRRVYPMQTNFVTCTSHLQVAKAIADMVTQSGGPYTAAAMGMALAAYECRQRTHQQQIEFLQQAAYTLSHARPTTVKKMQEITGNAFLVAKTALEQGQDASLAVFAHSVENLEKKYRRYQKTGEYLAALFPHGATVMTQCFGETIVGMMLRACKQNGNPIKVICPETRPYYQGARLTASCVQDMGFDVRVICDNMPAAIMQQEKVDIFTSAADVITMDGHVVNKVGTFQIALAAQYWQIPYYVSGTPSLGHPTIETVEIEQRNPNLVVESLGVKTVLDGVRGIYPAFDITPPKYCNGVVTDKGVFSPFTLAGYFNG